MNLASKSSLFQGLGLLALGCSLMVAGQETQLHCHRSSASQNQCQLMTYRLFGSQAGEPISQIQSAILEQQIYEPIPGKRSVMESRITLITAEGPVPLHDDYRLRWDQEAVGQINAFVQNSNQASVQVLIHQSRHLTYMGLLAGLLGGWMVKRAFSFDD